MGRIIKYNISKSDSIGTRTKSVSYSSNSSGGSSNSTTTNTGNVNCKLWGNDFEGNDIDSTLYVYGDIHLYNTNERDADTDEDDEDINDGTSGGGLLEDDDEEEEATGTLYSYGVESAEVYAKKKLYIHYPTLNDNKENVADLIKNNADKIAANTANIQSNKTNIAANKTEIDNLKGRVDTAETNITNLTNTVNDLSATVNNHTTAISNNTTNIQKNADDIAELQDKIANGVSEDYIKQIIELLAISKNGSYSNPIILISGRFRRSTVSNSKYYFFDGLSNSNMYVDTATAENGLLTIKLTSYNNATINISSVVVTLYKSGDTTDEITNTSIKGRSDGAHWFEARCDSHSNTKEIYVREFHEGDLNNDTWESNYWFADGGIKQINLIATGYITIPNNE